MKYLEVLKQTHEIFNPNDYLEIGVRNGNSLQLAKNNAIGVDPMFRIKAKLRDDVALMQTTSDYYFEQLSPNIRFDMAFVDGMHLFEYALRDICNVAKHLNKGGIIFVDDILPKSQEMAFRERETTDWTGDVWKVLKVIDEKAPEVNYLLIDTQPTGLALFYGDEIKNLPKILDDHDELVKEYSNENHRVPDTLISRKTTISPQEAISFIRNIITAKVS